MTPKQQRFVDEYLIDLNATQAAIRAGYSKRTAYSTGQENLKKPEIESAIQERIQERQKRTEITQDKVLEGLARVAMADIRGMFTNNGTLIDVVDLPDDLAMALASVEVVASRVEKEGGDGHEKVVEYTHKIKTNDRMKALELLGRHLKMFTDKTEHTFNPVESVLKRIYAENRGE